MNLTRRQFLQGMLAAASATMLPPVAFDDSLLDEPITDDVPMAYVQVGTQRLKSKKLSLEMSYDLLRFDEYVVASSRMYCRLTFEVPPSQWLYNRFVNGEICTIAIDVPGSSMTFEGDFVLTNLDMQMNWEDEIFAVTAERVNDGSARPLEIMVVTS